MTDKSDDALPTLLRGLNPGELFARGMQSVKMSNAGRSGTGWKPPRVEEMTRLFPGYQVIEILGHGGMGAVYKARQVSLDRFVAIKILPLQVSRDREFSERFVREAKTMARLQHPNIVALHDFGQTPEGHLFFVMEYVDGTTLHDLIHTGVLQPALAVSVIAQVCEGLACAHREGIVHRDVKPANVLVDRSGRAKVADFGLARSTFPNTAAPNLTLQGVAVGTPDYMSPEQQRGEAVDQHADIYALGVMLYEALTREVPRGAFRPASQRTGLHSRIDEVIARAMHQHPKKRWQSTMEMKVALETVPLSTAATIAPHRAVPPPVLTKPPVSVTKPAQKNPAILWSISGSVVAVLAALGFLFTRPATSLVSVMNGTPTPAKVQPSPTTKSGGEFLDALALVDPVRDCTITSQASSWKRIADGLQGANSARSAIALPVEVVGDYELITRVSGTVTKGEHYQWFLPVGRAGWFVLCNFEQHLTLARAGGQEDIKPSPLTPNVVHEVKAQITNTLGLPHCSVWIDGRMIVATKDPAPAYTNNWAASPRERPAFGVFMPQGGKVVLHSLKVRALAEGKVQPKLAKAASSPTPVSGPTGIVSFGKSRYQLVRTSMPWTQAKTEAELRGGHLAAITSKAEEDWIVKTFGPALPGAWKRIWLGGLKFDADSPWQWVTGEPFEFTHWIPGQPDAAKTSPPPYCLSLSKSSAEPGVKSVGWDDTVSSSASLGYLIEWDEPDVASAPAATTPVPATPAPKPKVAARKTPATPRPPSEADQRLVEIQARIDAMYARDVGKTVDPSIEALNTRLLAEFDREIAAATRAGRNEDVQNIAQERARIVESGAPSPANVAKLPIGLRTQLGTYTTQMAKLAADRAARSKPIHDAELKMLDTLFTEFAQANKTDAAQAVIRRRNELLTEWSASANRPPPIAEHKRAE